jgi:hypothetical protein
MNPKPRYIAAVLLYQIQNYLQLLEFLIFTHYCWFIFSFTAVFAIDATADY